MVSPASCRMRWWVAGLLAASGCSGTTEVVTPPPPPPVENATLRVVADPEDDAVVTALGWTEGLPEVQVGLQATTPGGSSETLISAADGTVSLTGLLAGDYAIDISRWLTAAERAQVPAGDGAVGFALRDTVRLGSSAEIELAVPASRRAGMVISEWAFAPIYSPSTGSYSYGGYLEYYNNDDTTAYLDGLLTGEAWTRQVEYPPPSPTCVMAARFTNDPSGLWARRMAQFPGTGHDHPVAPGGVVVVALDAIDHRPLSPGGLDLSEADFEFIGLQDVDNPAVPNMIDVGPFSSFLGHGLDFEILASVPYLAKRVDPATLVREAAPDPSKLELMKIEAADILDAAALLAVYDFSYPLCLHLVSPVLDRETARIIVEVDAATETILSAQRIRPAGQTFLQDTRRSASDLIAAPRTPGWVP